MTKNLTKLILKILQKNNKFMTEEEIIKDIITNFNHLDYDRTQRCVDKKSNAYKPRSVASGSGGVISPKVLTMVDIPPMKTLKHPKREQIICAVIAGKLDFLKDNCNHLIELARGMGRD